MTYEFIEYQPSDGIGRVFLARPQKLNALSRELQDELVDCMQKADDDPDIRVMTLMGRGRAFCAGYDITPPATPEAEVTAQAARDNIRVDIHRMKRTPTRWPTSSTSQSPSSPAYMATASPEAPTWLCTATSPSPLTTPR